jgi:hypothetical protein
LQNIIEVLLGLIIMHDDVEPRMALARLRQYISFRMRRKVSGFLALMSIPLSKLILSIILPTKTIRDPIVLTLLWSSGSSLSASPNVAACLT